jgi:hypothetical protein
VALLTGACSSQPEPQRPTGYAYAGPNSLNLRQDLGPRMPVVATVKHGERLEVLETRRRFAKVRAPSGVEGWADSSLLLTQRQMDDLEALAKAAARLPSQGKATVYDTLNIHTNASRPSPSFTQIQEGDSVDVLAHRVTMQTSARPPPKAPKKRSTPAASKGRGTPAEGSVPPPPLPPAPAPPPDWTARSVPRLSDLAGYKRPPAPAPAKPAGDDWYLVRLKDGKAGWALARMLVMSIPDEVAQYGEGQRITAYVSLGVVPEKDAREPHHNWLWTTASAGLRPHQFDSFRVFVWSARRRHYETAFIERNVKGYYPIEAVDLPGRDSKGFTVIIEEKDGRLYRRTYAFSGYHIRMIARQPWERGGDLPAVSEVRTFDATPGPEAGRGWLDRLRAWWR